MLEYYLLSFVGFIAIALNSIEVYLIRKRLSFIKPFEQLVLSLACSDIFTGVVAAIYGCYALIVGVDSHEQALKSGIVVATFAFTTMNLIAIGIDRYMAIRYPIKHRYCLTKNRVKIFIILLWIVLLVILVIGPAIAAFTTDNVLWTKEYFHYIASDWIIWSNTTMITYYTMIIIIALRRRAKLNQQSIAIEVRVTKREISLIWTCVISVCLYVTTSLPYAIYLKTTNKSSVYLAVLLLSNLIANPILYFGKTYRDRRNQITVN